MDGAIDAWLGPRRPRAGSARHQDAGRSDRANTASEWELVRTIADGLEWSHGWTVPAAQRLRFLLDFGYATGLRAGELATVTHSASSKSARAASGGCI